MDTDQSMQPTLEAQRLLNQGGTTLEKDDRQENKNQNNGLINTIINHNKKIKNIENKYNYIVNNFANSSHVREVVEKSKQLEKLVVGVPRPHESWRELVLVMIMIGVLLMVVTKIGKKYLGPWLIKYIHKKSKKDRYVLPTISGNMDTETHGDLDDFKRYWERRWDEQDKRMVEMLLKLNNLSVINTARDPIRAQPDE